MQLIGHALPPSYVFAGIRAIISDGTVPGIQLFLGVILSLAYIVVAYFILLAVYKKAIRTGPIARYSAKTVNQAGQSDLFPLYFWQQPSIIKLAVRKDHPCPNH
jgi:hypothetical protein